VRKTAQDIQFNLKDYEGSISHTFSPEIIEQLNQLKDFQKAYEINSELTELFKEVGISEDFGLGGLKSEDWSQFGPVQKTLTEFKSAYNHFQEEMVSTLQEFIRKKHGSKKKGQKSRSKKRR
jgi:hypothetical protein